MHTITDNVLATQSLAPASRTGTAGGSAVDGAAFVDCSDYEYVRFLFDVGAISTSGSVSLFGLQASGTAGSDAAAISGGSVAVFAQAGQNKLYSVTVKVDQLGTKMFVAGRISTHVNAETSVAACVIERYNARKMPVATSGLGADVRVVA